MVDPRFLNSSTFTSSALGSSLLEMPYVLTSSKKSYYTANRKQFGSGSLSLVDFIFCPFLSRNALLYNRYCYCAMITDKERYWEHCYSISLDLSWKSSGGKAILQRWINCCAQSDVSFGPEIHLSLITCKKFERIYASYAFSFRVL